jgi:hypothetical protein
LLSQLNVKTVAMGGLASGKPMQGIGGTKGQNAGTPADVQSDVEILVQLDAFNNMTEAESVLPGLIPFPLGRLAGTVDREYGMNTLNYILPNDKIPAMMRFEPADCHVYYTPQNVANVERMWQDVVDIAWNKKACAVGGFGSGSNATLTGPVVTTSTEGFTSGSVKEKVVDKMLGLAVAVVVVVIRAF